MSAKSLGSSLSTKLTSLETSLNTVTSTSSPSSAQIESLKQHMGLFFQIVKFTSLCSVERLESVFETGNMNMMAVPGITDGSAFAMETLTTTSSLHFSIEGSRSGQK